MANIVEYKPEHAEYLAARLHPANIAEIQALQRLAPLEGLLASVKASEKVWTGLDNDGNPAAIFGIGFYGLMNNVGCPWLMCREDIAKHGISLLKNFKVAVGRMKELVDVLDGEILAENTEVLKMCKWVGFDIGEARPYGIEGKMFCHIALRGER